MSIQKVHAPKTLRVKSGEKKQIGAKAVGATNKEEKELLYTVIGKGEVDPKGVFTAPSLTSEEETIIITESAFDDSMTAETVITIEAIKPLAVKPAYGLELFAGANKKFEADYPFPVSPSWHIGNLARGIGNIDVSTGLYTAPEIIPHEVEITIVLIDKNRPNNFAEAKIRLFPIEMKVGTQRKIHAGEENVQLPIESHNDSSGLDNFTCTIISSPMVGRIIEDNKYAPPLIIDSPEMVKVKATSKLDKSKSVILEFELDLPLCRACKSITNSDGRCTICGMPRSYGASIK
ncbi:MAG: hypothetical protein PHF50_00185 [Patescibacteria group bacterium]|nr:hypothetical protein [Patescibacteria group bacterium]